MKKAVYLSVVILVIVGGLWIWQNQAGNGEEVISYTTARADLRDLSIMISGSGTVQEIDKVDVKSRVNGEVSEVYFEENDLLSRGDSLVSFDSSSLVTQIKQAQLDIADAERKLNDMMNPSSSAVETARMKLAQAESNLAAREAELDKLVVHSPIDGVVTDIRVKKGDDVNTSINLIEVREQGLLVQTAVPESVIHRVEIGTGAEVYIRSLDSYGDGKVVSISSNSRLDGRIRVYDVIVELENWPLGTISGMVANVALDLIEGPYNVDGLVMNKDSSLVKPRISGTVDEILVKEGDIVKAGDLLVKLKSDTLDSQIESARLDVEQAQLNLDNLLSVSAEDIAIQKQRIELLKLKLDGLYKDLNNLTVTAPIEGTVTYKGVNEGDWVNNGTLLATITNQEQMQVVVDVDELDIIRVEEGQRAKVYIDAVSDRVYEGTVVSIGSAGRVKDGMSTFAVTILLDDNEFLRPGMTAYAEIILEGRENVLVVPSSAVFERNNKTMVRILVDGEPVSIEVEVGMRTDGLVEIVSGLNPGDRVITSSYQESSSTSSPSMFTLPGGGK